MAIGGDGAYVMLPPEYAISKVGSIGVQFQMVSFFLLTKREK
jgi:hypothetical protein